MTAAKNDRLTIRDIAALAGVSAGTVSRAMNGQPGVGAATRDRISAVIAEHGFRVDPTARQLSTGRSRTLGVLFPLHASEVVLHPVYPALLGALGDAAERAGYDLLLLTMSGQKSAHVLDTVSRRRVDGVVLPAAGARDPIIKQLVGLGAPTVLIGHRSKLPGVGWVDCTHDAAATELTQLMISGGRRSLVLLNGPTHVSACKLRSTGFWSAVKAAGIPGAREVSVPFDTAAAAAVALDLLRGPNRPDAIVCASDTIAAGVLETARTLGLSVPDDVAISGFDDRSLAAHTQPALTTVRMPLQETGHAAAHMLFAMLGDEPLTSRHIVLPTQVIVRDSTPRAAR
ncbi:LacI family transcriptional regulator [Asanoa ferruginea]|uniref:LacI family transcriptional regulator n=1 Tax=Asanoa ferruginea TaxID=53367 RepID=A0A3D9ZUE8_9ACTN|nr:LacI family DNA-binding transcriptional regulator [Asanoa ferruginea]REG00788.1 LacI family transcriptional regulator [Asanoa ferruginea]GIF47338.1 LacI family transcriptional regulator [Asanoa ferruginea]